MFLCGILIFRTKVQLIKRVVMLSCEYFGFMHINHTQFWAKAGLITKKHRNCIQGVVYHEKAQGCSKGGRMGAKRVHGSKGTTDEWKMSGWKGNWGGEGKGNCQPVGSNLRTPSVCLVFQRSALEKVKKNKIVMIAPVRVHQMCCWEVVTWPIA